MSAHILLVEDEEALRMTLGDRLRSEGYTVDYAVDGDEGFDKATRLPFDLIILDVVIPHIDGLELLGRLRKEGSAVPVLILSAKDSLQDRVRGLNCGADDYLVKPFGFAELLARVRALLRRPAEIALEPAASRRYGRA